MSAVQVQAFVETPLTLTRARTLNTVVPDNGVALMLGGKGAGRDRFLDWWWQVGAAHTQIPEPLHIMPADVLFINLLPAPSGSVPMSYVALALLWQRIQMLQYRTSLGGNATLRVRMPPLNTEKQFFRLFFEDVLPALDTLHPRAIVVGNAQYLDERAFNWLLLLRTHAEQGHALLARHALILSAQVEPGSEDTSKFGRLMQTNGETKTAWSEKILLSPMPLNEFKMTLAVLLRRNLNAIFADDVASNTFTQTVYDWTRGNWWYITEFARVLDTTLGPARQTHEPRVVTNAVCTSVHERWVKRTSMPHTEAQKEQVTKE